MHNKAYNLFYDSQYVIIDQQMLQSKILYEDKDVKVRQQCVTIKTYYFPFGNSKRIPICEIRQVLLINETSGRIWGTGSFQYWFACDKNRFDYNCFIAIDNGHSLKPAFTCLDNAKVYELIKELVQKYKRERIADQQ